MNKKLKFASAFLATSLVVTPVSSLVSNFDNVAMAENKDKKIKQEIKFSDYEFFIAAKKAYENGELEISKEKLKELESQLMLRGYWGDNKIVEFWDGAIDVYISGLVLSVIGSYGISKVLKYIPRINQFSGILGDLGGGILGGLHSVSNGVIIYFTKTVVPGYFQGSPSGDYMNKYIYQHWRYQ